MHSLGVGLFLCVLLASGYGAVISKSGLKREYCSWGAQYWCSSPKTAGLCGKTEWCASNSRPQDGVEDFPCSVAEKLIKLARSALGDSEAHSEYDIALKLAKACTRLTDSKERQQCKTLATKEETLLKLLKLVDTQLSPKIVAVAVGACPQNVPTAEVKGCTKCQDVLSAAQMYIGKYMTLEVYKKAFEGTCAKLGPGKQICQFVAERKYKMFYDGLLSASADTVCEGHNKCLGISPAISNVQSSDLCTTCKSVVADIRSLDRSQDVQDVIRNVIKSVCTKLGQLENVCDVLADEGLQYVFEIIATEMEPVVVCETLDLCSVPVQTKTPVARTALSFEVPIAKVDASVPCMVCQLALEEIEGYLAKNSTEQTLESFLSEICNRLPPTVSGQCNTFVYQYGPIVIKLLEKKLNPNLVCEALGLCKNSTGQVTTQKPYKYSDNRPANDELCDLCKYAATYIDTYLKKNASEAEIEALLQKVCDILPSSIKQQCDSLVQQYGPVIIQLLLQELDPTQVCTAIGLCTGNKVSTVPTLKSAFQQPKDEICDLCKYVVTYIDTFLKENATEAEIEALLQKVCDILPSSIKQQCDSLVQQYGPVIIQLLLQELDPTQVCTAIGLCTGNKVSTVPTLKSAFQQPKDEICDLCKYVVTYIDTFLKENATEAEIEALLQKVCDILPSSIKQQCDSLVQQYGPVIIQLLLQELDPTQVCTAIGLCTGNKVSTVPTLKSAFQQPKDEICDLCKYVVTYIDTFLKENATEAEIEALLEKVCKILPSSISQQCDSLVQQYGPVIIQLLLQELEPTQVCSAIGLCTGNKVPILPNLKSSVKQPNDELCDLCKYVVTYIDTFVKENATEAEIEALLEKVCKILPSSISQQCDSLVQQYGPVIIQLLLQELDPTQVCSAIGLCTGNHVTSIKSQAIEKVNGPVCALCEYVMQELDQMLAENSTQDQIEAALKKVCDIVPATLRDECKEFLNTYGPLILQLLVQELQPQQICAAIGLCSVTSIKLQAIEKVNGPVCALCEYVMQELDQMLAENSTQDQIEAALKKVCDIVPATLRDECKEFLNTYGPLILQLLVQELQPQQICAAIGLCSANQLALKPQQLESSASCALCELILSKLDSVLGQNTTEAEIQAELDKVCDALTPSLKSDCQTVVEQYAPIILHLLIQKMDPKLVCTAIRLCSAKTVMTTSVFKVNKQKTELCAICESVMQMLENILKEQSTKTEIISALDKVCDLLPGQDKELCHTFLPMYFGYVVDLIEQEIPPKLICKYLKVCIDDELKVIAKKQSQGAAVKKGELCPLCIYVLQELDKILETNASKKEIITALDKVCDLLPASIKGQCMSFVGLYLPYVVDLIVQGLSPEQICKELNLCVSQTKSVMNYLTHDTAVSLKKDELCPLCIYVFTAVDQLLAGNATEPNIEKALDHVCNVLVPLKNQCEKFVALYTPYVVDLILKELTPQEICNQLGLCTNTTDVASPSGNKPLIQVTSDPECAICELIMKYLEALVTKNTSVSDIESALDKVCHLLPSTVSSDCVTFVSSYTPGLVSLLSHFPPDQVCALIKACQLPPLRVQKAVFEKASMSEKPSLKGDNLCILCEFIATTLENLLLENETESQLIAALEKMCDVLPSMTDECKSVVDEYGPLVIKLLIQKLKPSQICSILSLCPSTKTKLALPDSWKKSSFNGCSLCQLMMDELELLLKQPFVEVEVEKALTLTCHQLPSEWRTPCDDLVQMFTPNIVDFIIKGMTPQEFCQFVSLCQRKRKDVPKKANSLTFMTETNEPATKPNEMEYCSLCKFALYDVQNAMVEPFWQNKSKAILYEVCSYLTTGQDACKLLVDMNFNALVNEITAFRFPIEFCQKIELCEPPASVLKLAGPECGICKVLVQLLDTFLQKNTTVTEVEKVLNAACEALIPKAERAQCEAIVRQYTPTLMQLLAQLDDPTKVCQATRLCPNASQRFLHLTSN
ncbi:unnamed protein product [Lymnaea stagnalis]|uniref:Pulmonary surfactant-associated protein B n=1 Tax=Lymnaea stagnalis TaxID=6523 RepID=A0AAV2IFU4_LYMST